MQKGQRGWLKYAVEDSNVLKPVKDCWLLVIMSEMTQNIWDTQEIDRTPLRPEEQNWAKNELPFIIIKPPGRIPDCMNKPFQSSAGAYMLSYSKGEWNLCLLQSLPKAPISFLSQEGNAPSFARDH